MYLPVYNSGLKKKIDISRRAISDPRNKQENEDGPAI
jgi:hypothetical protein